jgi:hypothetical protein
MSRLGVLLPIATAAALALGVVRSAADTVVRPTEVYSAPGRVLAVGLTGRHVAFGVGTTRGQCPHVELWLTEERTTLFFRSTLRGCKDGPSTGFGLPTVAVARERVLWLTYIGGNLRDWQLWTGTPTRRTPRLVRFVERDVDAPAPIVLGPGTREGIPYAVDGDVVYLGDDGRALFRWTSPLPVRALAAGAGPGRWREAALQHDGTVVVLDRAGRPVHEVGFERGLVRAIRLASEGLLAQTSRTVIVSRPAGERATVRLPAGAVMVDAAQGRILWTRAGDLGSTSIRTGASTRLVDGVQASPVLGQLEAPGLAWAQGRVVSWRAGALP